MPNLDSTKNILKKITHFIVIVSFIGTQFVYAAGKNEDNKNPPEISQSQEHINFQNVSADDLKKVGVDPNHIITMNTETPLPDGQTAQVDLMEVVTSSQETLNVFLLFKNQIRSVHEQNPNAKFKFLYLPDGSSPDAKNNDLSAQQIVDILDSIDGKKTETHVEKVDSFTIAKLRQKLNSVFSETTPRDIKLGIIRFTVNGVVTFGIYLMTYPIPISMAMALLTGFLSMSFGVLLKKYVRWISDNESKPDATRLERYKEHLYSPETLLLMMPFLIGLQDHNLVNAMNISATLGATVVVQNVYRLLKLKYPQKAFYYKWYATELMFMTIPFLILPSAGIYAHAPIFSLTAMSVILKTYLTGLMTVSSQGYGDDVTTAIQEDIIKEHETEKKDADSFLQKWNSKNIYKLSSEEQADMLNNSFTSKIKDKFTPYYLGSSIVSVASMSVMQLGNFNHNTTAVVAGVIGLLSLTAAAKVVWTTHRIKLKQREKLRAVKNLQDQFHVGSKYMCTSLFAL